jgi:hypothetical protein
MMVRRRQETNITQKLRNHRKENFKIFLRINEIFEKLITRGGEDSRNRMKKEKYKDDGRKWIKKKKYKDDSRI